MSDALTSFYDGCMTKFSDLVDVRASTINPGRLVISQKDVNRPVHVKIDHPGIAEYQLASGVGSYTGNAGLYLNGKNGREALYIDIGSDARIQIQVRESGVKHAEWLNVEGWQKLVGATQLTGNPNLNLRIY